MVSSFRFTFSYILVVWLVKQSFATYNQSMQRTTAALNPTFNWKEYWALPIVAILHVILITYQANPKSFNVVMSPNIQQVVTRMQVAIQTESKPVIKPVPKKKIIKKKPKKKIAKKAQKKQTKPNEKVVAKQISTQKLKALELAKKNFNSLLLNYSKPQYPRRELRRGVTGVVILSFWVKGNGEVERIEISKSSGSNALDSSAVEAAKLWKFKDLGVQVSQVVRLNKRVVYQIN